MAQQTMIVVNNLCKHISSGTVTVGSSAAQSFKVDAGSGNFTGGYQLITLVDSNFTGDTKVTVDITDGLYTGKATGTVNLQGGTNAYLCLGITDNGYVNMYASTAKLAATVG